jgi:hypothetical protein
VWLGLDAVRHPLGTAPIEPLPVSSAIIGKRRFLDKASMQPQQTSGHQTNIVQQVKSTGGEFYDQSNANKKHPNANTMLTEPLS